MNEGPQTLVGIATPRRLKCLKSQVDRPQLDRFQRNRKGELIGVFQRFSIDRKAGGLPQRLIVPPGLDRDQGGAARAGRAPASPKPAIISAQAEGSGVRVWVDRNAGKAKVRRGVADELEGRIDRGRHLHAVRLGRIDVVEEAGGAGAHEHLVGAAGVHLEDLVEGELLAVRDQVHAGALEQLFVDHHREGLGVANEELGRGRCRPQFQFIPLEAPISTLAMVPGGKGVPIELNPRVQDKDAVPDRNDAKPPLLVFCSGLDMITWASTRPWSLSDELPLTA